MLEGSLVCISLVHDASFCFSGCKVDLVFVVDSSGSINFADAGNWDRVLNFMVDVVDELRIGDSESRVGMVKFSTIAENEFYLNTHSTRDALHSAILGSKYVGGDTNTQEGINFMRLQQFVDNRGDRADVTNVAIVITDGVSRVNSDNTIPEAVRAQDDGILMFAIGVTGSVDVAEVSGISSPDHVEHVNYFLATDFSELSTIVASITEQACSQVATPEPTAGPPGPVSTPAPPTQLGQNV